MHRPYACAERFAVERWRGRSVNLGHLPLSELLRGGGG
jgi:hypothetical protein